jgi:rhodanese-related sulfurtransferase
MIDFVKKMFGNSTDYDALIKAGAIVLDVRTPGEFSSGHNKGAKNIPLDSIQNNINAIKKWNKPVITVCRSGARSAMAKSILERAGVEAYNGGSWNSISGITG